MTDRIKELRKQAGDLGVNDITGLEGDKLVSKFLEKFAKLIAEDCLRFVEVGRDKTDIRHLITACFLMDEEQE